MNCPICSDAQLVMSERQGIEIDYCPKCRGVWLDRGELDKIIERASAEPSPRSAAPAPAPAYSPPPQQQAQSYPQQQQGHGYPQHGGHYKKKKREGFLGELFDFD